VPVVVENGVEGLTWGLAKAIRKSFGGGIRLAVAGGAGIRTGCGRLHTLSKILS
jgi:hypothetical protein